MEEKTIEYSNLRSVMKMERVTNRELAELIKVDEKTLLNKLYGKTKNGFYWDEAYAICKLFRGKYTMEYLFYRYSDEDIA